MGININQPKTSSRAAKRRGDPESLDCFVAYAPRNDGLCKALFKKGGSAPPSAKGAGGILFSFSWKKKKDQIKNPVMQSSYPERRTI